VRFSMTVIGPGTVVGSPPPSLYDVSRGGGQVTFTIETIPGRLYRAFYKDDLDAPAWTQLDRDFVAAGSSASISDNVNLSHRFYRVLQVD